MHLNHLVRHRTAFILFILFLTVGCDQLTKFIAEKYLDHAPASDYLGGFFRLELVQNPGAFLSLGAKLSDSMRFWILTVAVAFSLVAIAVLLTRKRSTLTFTTGFSLVLGGGIGNLIDRIEHGSVTDFLNIGIGSLRTGIFNIADVAIMVGIGFVALDLFQNPKDC